MIRGVDVVRLRIKGGLRSHVMLAAEGADRRWSKPPVLVVHPDFNSKWYTALPRWRLLQ